MRLAVQHASRLAIRSSVARARHRLSPTLQSCTTSFSSYETIAHQPAPWSTQSKLPLKARATSVVESNFIRPSDIYGQDIRDLVVECCKLHTLEGMSMAHEILDRLLVEKRRLQLKGKRAPVPINLLQKIMYGWATLAGRLRVAQIRMKELAKLATEEAIADLENARGLDVPSSQPDTPFFNTFLYGCANAAKTSPGMANVARNTLSYMIELNAKQGWHTRPNQRSFTCVMEAYAHSNHPKAFEEAMSLLKSMYRYSENELKRYKKEYEETSEGFMRRKLVAPDAAIYTLVFKTLRKRQPEKVFELFEGMGKNGIRADPILCSVALHTFRDMIKVEGNPIQRLRLVKRAENLFWTMMNRFEKETDSAEGQSFLIAFNACLDVWSHAFLNESPIRCEMLLKQTFEQPGKITPNANSFNICLHAWSESNRFHADAGARAEKLLELQFEHSLVNGAALPDVMSYTFTIIAYADSDNPQKAFHARRLLQQLQDQVDQGKVSPSGNISAPFTAVLRACARTPPSTTKTDLASEEDDTNALFGSTNNNDQDIYSIAVQTFEELCAMSKDKETGETNDAVPDDYAYGTFLQCLAIHCPQHSVERSIRAKLTLDQAAAAGQVSRQVVRGYQAVFSDKSFLELIESESIPPSWYRNVPSVYQFRQYSKLTQKKV